jgi:hypothetical protein
VVLPFLAANDGIAAGEAIGCFDPYTAVMTAEALSKPGCVGRVAICGTGDARWCFR